MNRSVGALVAFVLGLFLAFAGTGTAAVVERDWKTPGDGLLTYDDVNQREWLDLTESRLALFPGNSLGARFENVSKELEPGGLFAGFQSAVPNDLTALAMSAGINVLTLNDFASNEISTRRLIDLVGISISSAVDQSLLSIGITDVMGGATPIRELGTLLVLPQSGANGQAGLLIDSSGDLQRASNTGAWLFRTVPEPSSTMPVLYSTALLTCLFRAFHLRR